MPQLEFAPQFFVVPGERLEDLPHAFERPAEAFRKDALEHDAELAELHVVRRRRPVKHDRAEQHVDEHRVAEVLAADPAGRLRLLRQAGFVVLVDVPDEPAKAVRLLRELVTGGLDEGGQIVGEPDAPAGEDDGRPVLRSEIEVVPPQPQLFEQLRQRPGPRPRAGHSW